MKDVIVYFDGVYTQTIGHQSLLAKRFPRAIVMTTEQCNNDVTEDMTHQILFDSTKVRYETFDALYYNKTVFKENSENERNG